MNLSIEVSNDLLIKGKIGSGKSTLIKLILGLYKPTCGEILINNIPINDINKESLRNRIGIVSQDVGFAPPTNISIQKLSRVLGIGKTVVENAIKQDR